MCQFQLQLTFFGLSPKDRINIYNEIHEICFHGKGGYDWNTVYNMPIWLRKYTFNKLKEWYDKEQNKQATKEGYLTPEKHNELKGKMKGPGVKPSYSTKASKK